MDHRSKFARGLAHACPPRRGGPSAVVSTLTPGLGMILALGLVLALALSVNEPPKGFTPRFVLDGEERVVRTLAFTPDGRRLVVCGKDGLAKILDPETGSYRTIAVGDNGNGLRADLSPDGTHLAVLYPDSTLTLWDLSPGGGRLDFPASAESYGVVAFSRDGAALAVAEGQGVAVWDLATGQERAWLSGVDKGVSSLGFSPDGRTLAIGGREGMVRLWELTSKSPRLEFRAHPHMVSSVVFDDSGRVLATASGADRFVRIWEAKTGVLGPTLGCETSPMQALAFAPGGRVLAAAGWDGTIRLWDMPSGRVRQVLEGHGWAVTALAFSADGRTLASAGGDSIRIWEDHSEASGPPGSGTPAVSSRGDGAGRTPYSSPRRADRPEWSVASGPRASHGRPAPRTAGPATRARFS